MNKKKINKTKVYIIIALFAFAIAVIALLVFLLQPKVTYISDVSEPDSIDMIDCDNVQPKEPFFKSNEEVRSNHKVKVSFKDGILDKFNYTYSAKFISEDVARGALSLLHADYNNYMGKIEIYQEDLMPTFSAIGTDGIINLYIDRKHFTLGTANFVFLDDDEYLKVQDMTKEQIQQLYESEGFKCLVKNNKS